MQVFPVTFLLALVFQVVCCSHIKIPKEELESLTHQQALAYKNDARYSLSCIKSLTRVLKQYGNKIQDGGPLLPELRKDAICKKCEISGLGTMHLLPECGLLIAPMTPVTTGGNRGLFYDIRFEFDFVEAHCSQCTLPTNKGEVVKGNFVVKWPKPAVESLAYKRSWVGSIMHFDSVKLIHVPKNDEVDLQCDGGEGFQEECVLQHKNGKLDFALADSITAFLASDLYKEEVDQETVDSYAEIGLMFKCNAEHDLPGTESEETKCK